MKISLLCLALLVIIGFSACKKSSIANGRDAIEVIDTTNSGNNHMYFTSWDASHRSMVFMYGVNSSGPYYHILSESPPDAMQDASNAIAAGLKAGIDKAGSGDANFTRSALMSMESLGKRSMAVNMLRDALYRLSEMNFNGYLNRDITDSLVRITITQTALVAQKEADADMVNSQLELARTKSEMLDKANQLADKIFAVNKTDSLSMKQKEDIIKKLIN